MIDPASRWPSRLPGVADLESAREDMVEAAKAVFDAWEQGPDGWDEELGQGGICQDVAAAMVEKMAEAGFVHSGLVHASVGENHVFAVVLVEDGVYSVDIPPSVYETGSGYVWKKRSDADFSPDSIDIVRISDPVSPDEFERRYFD